MAVGMEGNGAVHAQPLAPAQLGLFWQDDGPRDGDHSCCLENSVRLPHTGFPLCAHPTRVPWALLVADGEAERGSLYRKHASAFPLRWWAVGGRSWRPREEWPAVLSKPSRVQAAMGELCLSRAASSRLQATAWLQLDFLTDGQFNEPIYRGSFNMAITPINLFAAGLE